jgi:hypothetical protein
MSTQTGGRIPVQLCTHVADHVVKPDGSIYCAHCGYEFVVPSAQECLDDSKNEGEVK